MKYAIYDEVSKKYIKGFFNISGVDDPVEASDYKWMAYILLPRMKHFYGSSLKIKKIILCTTKKGILWKLKQALYIIKTQ